jgi:hypothetical protein
MVFRPHWGTECLCVALIGFGGLLAARDASLRQRDLTWQLMTAGEFARASVLDWRTHTTTLTPSRAKACTTNDVKWARCATTGAELRSFSSATTRVDLMFQDHARRRHIVRDFVVDTDAARRLELDFTEGNAPKTLPIRYRVPDAAMDIEQEQRDVEARRRKPDQAMPCLPEALCRQMIVDRPDFVPAESTVLGMFDISVFSAAGWFLISGVAGLSLTLGTRLFARHATRQPTRGAD